MDPIRRELRDKKTLQPQPTNRPLYSAVTGELIQGPKFKAVTGGTTCDVGAVSKSV